LNKEVVNIDWSNDKIVIKCADGSTFNADHVIVTVSLGVLKDRHTSLFTPNLPANNIQAIENYGFGAVGKIFLEFDEPFWPENETDFMVYYFLWKDEDEKELIGTEREWLLDLIGLSRIDAMPKLIGDFVAGKHVKKFEEISDEQMLDDAMWILEKFLGKNLPRASGLVRSKWLTNRNFLGTYSYLSMDSQNYNILPENLAKSVEKNGVPVILFAGEATDFKYPGDVAGAVGSGLRVAQELMQKLSN
jgi:spermine oxidase